MLKVMQYKATYGLLIVPREPLTIGVPLALAITLTMKVLDRGGDEIPRKLTSLIEEKNSNTIEKGKKEKNIN